MAKAPPFGKKPAKGKPAAKGGKKALPSFMMKKGK